MEWFDLFLERMSGRVPVDFFSWHLYTDDPRELEAHANFVNDKLYEYGCYDTENIFNEWNYIDNKHTRFDDMKTAAGAAFVTAAFSVMQYGPVDKAMYYDAMPTRSYCGLYHFPSQRVAKPWYAFKAFNELYRLGACAPAVSEDKTIYPIAAVNGDRKAILLSAFGCEEKAVAVDMSGLGGGAVQAEVYRLDEEKDLALVKVEYFTADHAKLILAVENNTTFLIQISSME